MYCPTSSSCGILGWCLAWTMSWLKRNWKTSVEERQTFPGSSVSPAEWQAWQNEQPGISEGDCKILDENSNQLPSSWGKRLLHADAGPLPGAHDKGGELEFKTHHPVTLV